MYSSIRGLVATPFLPSGAIGRPFFSKTYPKKLNRAASQWVLPGMVGFFRQALMRRRNVIQLQNLPFPTFDIIHSKIIYSRLSQFIQYIRLKRKRPPATGFVHCCFAFGLFFVLNIVYGGKVARKVPQKQQEMLARRAIIIY